jgi:hypothetical protein
MEERNNHKSMIMAVDDFIKELHDGDIKIAPKARKLFTTYKIGKTALGLPRKRTSSLADELGWAITDYQRFKDKASPSDKLQGRDYSCRRILAVKDCLDWIERARTWGVVQEVNLNRRFKECQEQNNLLKEQLANMKKLNNKLASENDRLHKLFPKNKNKDTEIGDVEEK